MGLKRLWAPWRVAFVKNETPEKGCVFCNRLRQKDGPGNLIVFRGTTCFVILNKYPYNTGHVLVMPIRHVGKFEKLRTNELHELMELTQQTVGHLTRLAKPHGLNLGMNLGKSAGAGVPGHVHMHIVPRWDGDTNFLPIIGETKLISVPLDKIYAQLRDAFTA
jgi:ATP adenylyltransferase